MRLRAEKDARLFAAAHRVRVGGGQAPQEGVQPAGGNTRFPALCRSLDGLAQLVDVASGQRRDVDRGRPPESHQIAFHLALQVAAAFLVGEIPLVEGDHQGPSRFFDVREDPQVLVGDRGRGVDHHHADLSAFDCGLGAQAGVELVPRGFPDTLADTRGVNEPVHRPTDLDDLVYGIDGGSGDIGDHRPLLLGQLVQQRGLAHVRFPDDRNPARPADLVEILPGSLRQDREHRVQEITGAPAVHGGDGVRLPQPQIPHGGGHGLVALVIHLVRGQHHGFPGTPEHLDHGLVLVEGAHGGVDDEQHRISHRDCELRLLRYLLRHAPGVRDPAAGVHQHELATIPVRVVRDTVTGDARNILHHGLPAAQDAVDQRGLADVRTTHHRHHGLDRGFLAHASPPIADRRIIVAAHPQLPVFRYTGGVLFPTKGPEMTGSQHR